MWPDPQATADLVTFTEDILNGKLQFLYSAWNTSRNVFRNLPNIWWCIKIDLKNLTLSFSLKLAVWIKGVSTCKKLSRFKMLNLAGKGGDQLFETEA